jgi:hypothetical protein
MKTFDIISFVVTMARSIVFIIVFIAFGWSVYVGYYLLSDSVEQYAPDSIFNETDKGVLRINKMEEVNWDDFQNLFGQNSLSNELKTLKTNLDSDVVVFASRTRNILILQSNKKWQKARGENIKTSISLANVNIAYQGKHLIIYQNESIIPEAQPKPIFTGEDKKATANYWEFNNSRWSRTDIYALERGYFEYRSENKTVHIGPPVADTEEFTNVLPQNIDSYIFFERFYSKATDSVFNASLMGEWVDRGYVLAVLNNEEFLVSDYRSDDPPSIVLASSFLPEATNHPQIKAYKSIPLTSDFPNPKDTILFLLELEDKVIITSNLATAIKIELHYQLGETLSLNNQKLKQFFSDLPQFSNFRLVSNEQKQSITLRNQLEFTVTTKPPSEKIVSEENMNWVNSAIPLIMNICPIPDHIRGGNSVFVYNQDGQFALVSSTGQTAWKGSTTIPIQSAPQIVDIFENNKKQLLFSTQTEVHLIDLNGQNVGNFPYKTDQPITTTIHPFKWKNTLRFLVGNAKGELIVLNNSGNELNIVQSGAIGLAGDVFAVNVGGTLRGWAINKDKDVYLSYLETPAKAENKGKINAMKFTKNMGEIIGFEELDENVIIRNFSNQQERHLGKGKLSSIYPLIVLRDQNRLTIFNTDYSVRWSINLPFNEIGTTLPMVIQQKNYLLLTDYLKNKVHLLDNSGNNIAGFPKEASELVSYSYDSDKKTLTVYTILSGSLISYSIRF